MQLVIGQDATFNRYKNRIGMNVGYGGGFKTVEMAKLTDGTTSSISFGGGVIFNLEYGREFNRHFDLTLNAGGLFGQLDKSISNGSVSFSRTNLSLTPSFMLPLGSSDKIRLKIGAGIDWLYGTQLSIDLSKLTGGYKDDWKYDNTIGEHLSLILEMNLGKRLSFNAGLNLYNAQYKFKSGDKYEPTSSELKTPNGSGAGFILGLCYNFNWKKSKS